MRLNQYRKLIVAIVGALGIIAAQVPTDAPAWVAPAISIATAFGVWLLRNDPATPTKVEP